ncbi:MAG: hypothetical protein ABIN96_07175 [Rubrivivax sp.]
MSFSSPPRLAILYPGDRAACDRSSPAESRFASLFDAFAAAGVAAEPAVYNDDFADEVLSQLQHVQGVLVWHNPTHPDTILRMGTKDVLLYVCDLPFGSGVHRVGVLSSC